MFDLATSWQDLAIMVSGFIFCAALVPTIWNQMRVKTSTIPVITSLTTGVALAILIPVYASVGLWIGATVIATNLLLWVVVLTQRMCYKGE